MLHVHVEGGEGGEKGARGPRGGGLVKYDEKRLGGPSFPIPHVSCKVKVISTPMNNKDNFRFHSSH